MCGPYVHYVIERAAEAVLEHPRRLSGIALIKAGINIATGEPCTNDLLGLTGEEKDTLRWHFTSEYPTPLALWKKHIKPHCGANEDSAEWMATMLEGGMLGDAGKSRCLTMMGDDLMRALAEDHPDGYPHIKLFGNVWVWLLGDTVMASNIRRGLRRTHKMMWRAFLARWLQTWRHRENRAGYWANPVGPAPKPKSKVAFVWDAKVNRHGQLLVSG